MSDTPTPIQTSIHIDLPFTAVDAILGAFLRGDSSTALPWAWTWTAITYGSSEHRHYHKATGMPLVTYALYAVGLERTFMIFTAQPRIFETKQELDLFAVHTKSAVLLFAEGMQVAESVDSIRAKIEQRTAAMAAKAPHRKTRPGPAPEPWTAWARARAREGKTIDELLDDYMKMRGDDIHDTDVRTKRRESLRKAIEPSKLG